MASNDPTVNQKCPGIPDGEHAHVEAPEPHVCPYMTDIDDRPDFRCTCCEVCTDECSDDR